MSNSLRVIAPFKYEGMWVFDDPTVGLDKEPFVSGAEYKAIILHILHLVQCIEWKLLYARCN